MFPAKKIILLSLALIGVRDKGIVMFLFVFWKYITNLILIEVGNEKILYFKLKKTILDHFIRILLQKLSNAIHKVKTITKKRLWYGSEL